MSVPTRRTFLRLATGASAGLMVSGCTDPKPPAGRPDDGAGTEGTSRTSKTMPDDLLLGLATSAYQIEGSVDADGRGRSIWDTFCDVSGAIDDGSSGAVAADHYRRWEEDVALMASLGVQTYRFSIAWPRIQPAGRGRVNAAGLDFYKRLVARLVENGISPVATLYHWDLPQALQDEGGWANREVADWFSDYAAAVYSQLDGVERWLTINEAKVIALQGYLAGTMAPGISDPVATGRAVHHLGLAHGRAVQAFRASGRPGAIGPCVTLTPCYPVDGSEHARRWAGIGDAWNNAMYLDPILRGRYPELPDGYQADVQAALEGAALEGDMSVIGSPIDYVGVNYYTPSVFAADGRAATYFRRSAAGWQQLYPEGLYEVLRRVHEDYAIEVAVTENGVPDDRGQQPAVADQARTDFMHRSLAALLRAIDDGVRVSSYHAWSLLDNFEWARGYTERWGVVRVEPGSLDRTPKDSAQWYAEVIRDRRLPARA